jgi:hypothetical protein
MVRRARAIRAGLAAVVLAGAAVTPACGPARELRPHLTDEQYESKLDEHFKAGMTPDEVNARLDELKIPREDRHWYPESGICAGGQLLARVYEQGGKWIDRDDATIEWIDTWFCFGSPGPGGPLIQWSTHRGSQRYFEGEPVFAPPESETQGPTRRYPFPPPLPARPPAPEKE